MRSAVVKKAIERAKSEPPRRHPKALASEPSLITVFLPRLYLMSSQRGCSKTQHKIKQLRTKTSWFKQLRNGSWRERRNKAFHQENRKLVHRRLRIQHNRVLSLACGWGHRLLTKAASLYPNADQKMRELLTIYEEPSAASHRPATPDHSSPGIYCGSPKTLHAISFADGVFDSLFTRRREKTSPSVVCASSCAPPSKSM